jgi:hypothetical protein
MPLLINECDKFEIAVRYLEKENKSLQFFEDDEEHPANVSIEKFIFKRPSWSEAASMMSSSVLVSATNGQAILDPYKFMDISIKTLLKEWTLKDGDEALKITHKTIEMLDPNLVQYLFAKMQKVFSPEEPPELAKKE